MKKIISALYIVAIAVVLLFLVIYILNHRLDVLDPKGIIALAEKNLLITSVSLMMVVIIPVFVLLAVFSWRYRASNKHAKYTPDWHSNKALEITWWVIPSVIIIMLGILTWTSTHELDPYKPLVSNVQPITIEVVALNWKWLFIYPEEHIATVNFVEFPKDTPINFKITADAPMNAFWIPQLGGQVYAMSGMTAQLHLMGSETGDYKGLSSNFSGDGFSDMKFVARVALESNYEDWLRIVKTSPEVLTFDEYTRLLQPTKNNPPKIYGSVEDGLYTKVIMKFMAPMEMGNMPNHYK